MAEQTHHDHYTPTFNIPSRKVKGLIKLFGGMAAPFYYTAEVVEEGTVMRFTDSAGNDDKMQKCTNTEGELARGLAMQATYDDTALGQLQGYHFSNDTRQRLDGMPIGLLTGAGWAILRNYSGTVAVGEQAYVNPSGILTNDASGNEAVPVVFESAGVGDPTDMNVSEQVRVRFDFRLATGATS